MRMTQQNQVGEKGRMKSGRVIMVMLIASLLVSLLLAGVASRVFAALTTVNPTNSVGYPESFVDSNGLALEFCDIQNQAELTGGWCLLLPADTVFPESFPNTFADEHFYYAADSTLNFTGPGGPGDAVLVLGLEAAFGRGPARPTDQVVFGRTRLRIDNLPYEGTYTVYHPYGTWTFPNQVAGDRLFFTDDIGINCGQGNFECALASDIGPFLRASATPGGAALALVPGPGPGKLYLADPARLGPVTGSPVGQNKFRIEGPNGFAIETTDFSLMGRQHNPPAPPVDTPVAVGDQKETDINTAVDISVLSNDKINGVLIVPADATINIVTPAANGDATVNPDGTVHYVPDLDVVTPNVATGPTDTFTYTVTVNSVVSNEVTVQVVVKPLNLAAVGANSPSNGYPGMYEDNNGLQLEFCNPINQAELNGGWCLLLAADTTLPETFPANFADEHFYYAADSGIDFTGANGLPSRALLVLGLEAAFGRGPARVDDQIVFGRVRVRIDNLPVAGTYTVRHPYGTLTFPDQQLGGSIFFTDDIGINCGQGIFDCALNSDIGPFLRASDTPGGLPLAPVAGPVAGKTYIADPAREGPVTGSPVGQNEFRIEGPGGLVLATNDFNLMGRLESPDPVNVALAINDAAVTDEDVPVSLNLLTNDKYNGNPINMANSSYQIVTNPLVLGSIATLPNGSVTYTPNPGASGTEIIDYTLTSEGVQDTGQLIVTINPMKNYLWNWYDSKTMSSWIVMGNPSGALASDEMTLSVAGGAKSLPNLGAGAGVIGAGQSLSWSGAGLQAGPALARSRFDRPAVLSQRSLMGDSLEEVPAIDEADLSDHYWWTWYDSSSSGFQDWIVVTNTSRTENLQVSIQFTNLADGTPAQVTSTPIGPGGVWTHSFTKKMGGPVELKAFVAGGNWDVPADRRVVAATQRVISGGKAFNEMPGIADEALRTDYQWTWYDMSSQGFTDWVMIANPDPLASVDYDLTLNGVPVGSGTLDPGEIAAPTFNGQMGGPLELTATGNVIATQRVVAGKSFGEVPGYPLDALGGEYHWSWYDMQTPGVGNWIMISNESGAALTYDIRIGGVSRPCPLGGCVVPNGGIVTPSFAGIMGGPVQVTTSRPAMVSQRVLWKQNFNEVLGTVLPPVPPAP